MDIQEIFNRVIDAGLFEEHPRNIIYPGMCNSLEEACRRDLVTQEERKFVFDMIDGYMKILKIKRNRGLYLGERLKSRGLPHDFEARLAIYRDWSHRPIPTTED